MKRFRLLSATAAVAAVLIALAAATPAADAAPPGPADVVASAIHAQLTRHHGGVVHGTSVTYADEGVTVSYAPKPAAGTAVAATGFSCTYGEVCLYSDGAGYTQVLSTSSLWCPNEHTSRSYLFLSDYGIWGNVRSVYDDTPTWWARMFWDNGWWRGTQWSVGPLTTLYDLSASNVNAMTVCMNESDLGRHP